MIKLKLNRDQLFALCTLTNPAVYEAKVEMAKQQQRFNDLDTLFNLIQIGEDLSKKWLYTCKHSNKISLKYSEAASLLKHLVLLEWDFDRKSYEYNLIIILKQDIHQQLTNYQRRFYGQPNRQNLLAGGNQIAGGAAQITAG